MRILYCTQSNSLALFHALNSELASHLGIDKVGFTLADSYMYKQWLNENLDFEQEEHILLKEWEVTSRRSGRPNLEALARYEHELGGEAGLFGAIVADRRLFMGLDCTFTQDYRRRFTDDELLCILENGLEKTEKLFDDLQPQLVVSFICVTILDYLVYLFAKARDIRFLNLRPSRVGDRVGFASTLNDPSPEFASAFQRILQVGGSAHAEEAEKYIKRVREQHGRYEGVVRPSERPALQANLGKFARFGNLLRAAREYLTYRRSIAAHDNHVPDPMRALFFSALVNPWRAKCARRYLVPYYLHEGELAGLRYAFFPLHTEPEVSLLVYGRPYVNQIEIIRMLAMSLPADMVLVIKEHPWMVGKRSRSAYSKMLNIPRVRIANPSLEARSLIQQSVLVAVVTGSVALEAAMLRKPVITFGDCPYNLLPDSMVRRCADPRHLPTTIRQSIETYTSDETVLKAYVSAVYETSASVNLYSVLLGKKGVYLENQNSYDEEIVKLAKHLMGLLGNPLSLNTIGSAGW